MKKYALGLVCLLVFSFSGWSQQPAVGTADLSEVPLVDLPRQDNKSLQTAELAARKPGRAEHFATRIEVDIDPTTHGTWEILPGNLAVWRLRLRSEDAYSLNLGFTEYEMPPGGLLLLYSPSQDHLQGPFSRADNEDHAQLWTPILYGEEMVLELQVPVSQQNQVKLHLSYVHHDFMGFGLQSAASGSCNLDVVCGAADGWGIVDGYRDIIQSAGSYTLNGVLTCSGALINNARNDCTPYFLTANHCGVTSNNAASMVAYWNYQNSTCRQPNSSASGGPGNGQLNQFNSGAIFRAAWFESDFALVEMDDPLDPAHDPFLAGWSRLTPADSMIGIHHPGVEEKRISFDFDPNGWTSWFGNTDSTHVVVNDWDIGTTEGGSSGSPLFDQDKRIIGQLHGGGAACGNNLEDEYGWVVKSWEGAGDASSRLRDWLDPDNTGAQFIDGRSCAFSVTGPVTSAEVCNSAVTTATFNVSVAGGFQGPVTLSTNNLPAGATASFATNPVQPGASTVLTLGNLGSTAPGVYVISTLGTDGSNTDSLEITLTITAAVPATTSLNLPADGATGVASIVNFDWAAQSGANYDIEVATDAAFANIVAMGFNLATPNFTSTLPASATYFWRVRSNNACGAGPFSNPFTFSTAQTVCNDMLSANVPLTISDGSPNLISSTINHVVSGSVLEVELMDVQGLHTWIADLTFTLISPQGTQVVLIDQACFNQDDFHIGWSDAATGTPPCPYDDGLSYPPTNPLSAFNGENPLGTWTLEVQDNANNDGGELQGWSLRICQSSIVAKDVPLTGEFKVYPVPSEGAIQMYLDGAAADNGKVEILGLNGQVLRTESWPWGQLSHQLDLSDLPDGFYLVRLTTENGAAVRKIVLAR